MIASVVGGGDSSLVLYQFLWWWSSTTRSEPSSKLGPSSIPSPLSYPGALVAGVDVGAPFPVLWTRASFSIAYSFPAKLIGPAMTPSGWAACPLPGELGSGDLLVASRMFLRMGCVWFGWSGLVSETKAPTGIARGVGFSPELVPAVYCFRISFCILFVIWATGVGSGWCRSLYVSTGVGFGLLIGLSQCFVADSVEHHGRSLELGLSPTPKGVRLIVPSGILKSLTVLVSWPANGSSFVHDGTSVLLWRRNNSHWAPNQDVFILVVYISIVSVIVFLTLITFHYIV